MKKNEKTIAAYNSQRVAKEKVLKNLIQTKNTLSDEALAEAEALIAEKESEIATIKEMVAELEASEEDKSEELLAKIAELTAKVTEVENSLKEPKGLVEMQNFVNSKAGEKAFMKVVQNSATGADFRANWKAELSKNGITPEDIMLPPAVLTEINDTWESTADNFLSLLDITGLLAMKTLTEQADTNAETSRAKGHKKGNEKDEQVLDFAPKEIRAQLIYKYITIDRETIEFEDTTGALMRYVSRELASRILHEIMRAVLVGDGRLVGDKNKISKFEAIVDADAMYKTDVVSLADAPTIEEVATAVDAIEADGDIVLAMSKQTARALRSYVAAAGGTTRYQSLEELAAELGVAKIITTRLLKDATNGAPSVIAFVGKAYKVVGELTMRGFENFILSYNKKEYLTEVYAGGALAVPYSASVVYTPGA